MQKFIAFSLHIEDILPKLLDVDIFRFTTGHQIRNGQKRKHVSIILRFHRQCQRWLSCPAPTDVSSPAIQDM